MTLREFFDDVYLLERDLRESSEYQMRRSIAKLQEHVGGSIQIHELNADMLNLFLREMSAIHADKTVHRIRGDLLCLWRMAHEHGYHSDLPKRIRKIKVARKVPRALLGTQLRMLIKASAEFKGFYFNAGYGGRILRSKFWNALLRVVYDTGLRRADVLALRRDQIDAHGVIVVPVLKLNGMEHVCRVRPATLAAIDATYPPQRPRIFPFPHHKRFFWSHLHKIFDLAGIPRPKRTGLHTLRKTGATYLELERPGVGKKYLGHLTSGLAERHYIDPTIIGDIPIPPDLVGDDAGKVGAQ